MSAVVMAAAAVSFVVAVFSGAITGMFHEEIRTRLSRLPNAVIFLIALRFPREIRRDLVDEWTAELEAVVSETEGLPLTRLLAGLEYAWDLYRFQRADGRMLTGIRRRHRRERVAILASLMVFQLIVMAGSVGGYRLYREYIAPPDFTGPGTGSVLVQIKPGESAGAVGQRLAALGVVASAQAFFKAQALFNAAKVSPQGNTLRPGTYRLHEHMKATMALDLLLNPADSRTSS